MEPLLGLLRETYEGFEDIDGEVVRQMVERSDYSLAAFAGGEPLAFASLQTLVGVVELRNLAVDNSYPRALEALLRHILSQYTTAPSGKIIRIGPWEYRASRRQWPHWASSPGGGYSRSGGSYA